MMVFTSIIDARHYQNYSQAKLAEKTGVDRADISKIERGLLNPSLRILNRLATGLGMELEIKYLLRNEGMKDDDSRSLVKNQRETDTKN